MAIDTGRVIEYVFLTKKEYSTLTDAQKSRTRIFFIEDTGEIYKGAEPYNNSVVIVNGELPLNPAESKIYIHEGQFKIFKDGKWSIIEILTTTTDVIDEENLNKGVTANAVKNYIDTILANYQSNDESIFKNTQDALEFANDTTKSRCGQIISVMINGVYVPYIITEHRGLKPISSSGSTELDVEDTSTIEVDMSKSGILTANVKVSEQLGNTVEAREDGIYVPTAQVPIDIII